MGLLNELAPELTVQQWSGLPQGISARLKNNRGKVICMLLFQTDCEFSLQRGSAGTEGHAGRVSQRSGYYVVGHPDSLSQF